MAGARIARGASVEPRECVGTTFSPTALQEVGSVEDPAVLSAEEFWATFLAKKIEPPRTPANGELVLDNTAYHHVSMDDVPRSLAEGSFSSSVTPEHHDLTSILIVDVLLNDNGRKFDTLLVAGLAGSQVRNSGGDSTVSESGGVGDTLTPLVGWWMFIKKGSPKDGVEGDAVVPEIPVDKDFDLEAGLKGVDGKPESEAGGAKMVAQFATDYGRGRLFGVFSVVVQLFGCLHRPKTKTGEAKATSV